MSTLYHMLSKSVPVQIRILANISQQKYLVFIKISPSATSILVNVSEQKTWYVTKNRLIVMQTMPTYPHSM